MLDQTETIQRQNLGHRHALGIFYTPGKVADVIAAWGIRHKDETVLEPSFGGCAFLHSAAQRLMRLGRTRVHSNLMGFDVDSAAFDHLCDLLGTIPASFARCDFLSFTPAERTVDVILGNPPFTGYRQLSSIQRASVKHWRARFDSGLCGTAALWAYFLAHSLHFLRSGGRLAFVLPSAFLLSDYAGPLRVRLGSLFDDVTVVNVNERLFRDAGVDARTCILLASGYAPLGHPTARPLRQVNLDSFTEASFLAAVAGTAKTQHVTCDAAEVLRSLAEQGFTRTVGEYARPVIGEVTGDTGFFVKSWAEWLELGIGAPDLAPIISSPSQIAGLDCHHPTNLKWMLKPGLPLNRPAKKYLSTYPPELIEQRRTFKKRDPWWNVSYTTDAAAFVASVQYRYFRVIANEPRYSCTNTLYKLVPVDGRADIGARLALASLSSVSQLAAEAASRSLGRGALKLEPSDVKTVMVPCTIMSLPPAELSAAHRRATALVLNGNIELAQAFVDELVEYPKDSCLIISELVGELRSRRFLAKSDAGIAQRVRS